MEESTKYDTWQHHDLVQRVNDLEQQLRSQTQLIQQSIAAPANGTPKNEKTQKKQKKQKKPHKPFDASRYSSRKIALKFSYLGAQYNGFEHHANNTTPAPTIEEVLWRALKKTRLIFPERKAGQSEDDVCWDGCEYSKCGRTDKGVSAFGQVVALRVRSARPVHKAKVVGDEQDVVKDCQEDMDSLAFDSITDELPYIQLLNRVLPPEIRVLAWCADPPEDFNARFSCRERRYRYFFTNPAYLPSPGNGKDGWLDLEAMELAARKYEGVHDFRNFCKVDPSKQITNFERQIFHAGIHAVGVPSKASPKLYYFEVRGSAFLWHQVRHLVAILFLVGQGYEEPGIVDRLFDVEQTTGKPMYEMASDVPLVLWDCIFPELSELGSDQATDQNQQGYTDSIPWIYVGDKSRGQDDFKRIPTSGDGRYGANGLMEDLWSLWRRSRLHEVLASQLMDVVARQGSGDMNATPTYAVERGARIFDGSDEGRSVGTYVPVMQRARMEPPNMVNERYAARKSLAKSPVIGPTM